ncbi:DUF4330 domain-containing protein [Peptoniphilus sp. EMRHCC_23]|uniref:DUF4330 domain-containing protein n=1 Tax=Peptoniphilus rachelemmaiella TaxID=2811779 RepID=UPI001BFFDA2E|nr:DUF4330 domain-containing protein [Peptoniphilus rachelemmaiella]
MIDKKGKLFGKINIIDCLFLLILIVAVVGGASRFKESPISVESTSKGTMTFLVDNVRMPTAENITEGQDIYSSDKGTYLGKILRKTVKPYKDAVEYEGQWVKAPVPDKYSIYLDVEVDIKDSDKSYAVGSEEIRVGNDYRVKTKTSAFTGICVGIKKDGE